MRIPLFPAVLSAALLSANAAAADPYRCEQQDGIQQLRIYEIERDNRDAFHDRFRDHALRIMRRHDFNIGAVVRNGSGVPCMYSAPAASFSRKVSVGRMIIFCLGSRPNSLGSASYILSV